MPIDQLVKITELTDREVTSQGSLDSLLSIDSNPNMSRLNKCNIIATITNPQNPAAILITVLDHQCRNFGFLSGRNPGANNSRQLHSNIKEILFKILESPF